MTESVKVLIERADGKYLILTFNEHPYFGNDIDLPGGELDAGEDATKAAIREIHEELGWRIGSDDVKMCASTRQYSRSGNLYNLMEMKLKGPAAIKLSREHINYEWLNKSQIIERGAESKNPYLRLLIDMVEGAFSQYDEGSSL